MHDPEASQLDRIIIMLTEFSQGNFNARQEVPDADDPLSFVIRGLNSLGEELDKYRQEVIYQRTLVSNILNNIDEVVYVRDIKQNNPAASRYTFVSSRSVEIIGLGWAELDENPGNWIKAIHPEDQPKTTEMLKRALDGKEIVVTYRMYHRVKQQYRWIEDRITTKINPRGEIIHLYGTARDITEQQETNLALERTSQLVTRLITSSDQVFYIVSLDQENPYKNTFTYLSEHVEGIIGFSVEDVRNDQFTWLNAIHPDDLDHVKAATRDMFKFKKPGTRFYRMRHKISGEYIWLEDYVVPIMDKKGWIREFYASARDITATKTAELEREKLIVELSRKNDELMQFSHIVSHNLRAPVANILGLAQLIQGDRNADESADTTGHILQAAMSMDGLLRDLNTVLSVRSTLQEKMERFSLTDVISSVCINLKNEIDESGTTFNILIDESTDELHSIKSYVQSALFNLISNAIKYRSAERIPVISIRVFKKAGEIVIEVEDNGLGIDLPAHKDRIFVLYGRLHYDREGKGLGLYMTKTQIESLNGTIEVESERGVGSVFRIVLRDFGDVLGSESLDSHDRRL